MDVLIVAKVSALSRWCVPVARFPGINHTQEYARLAWETRADGNDAVNMVLEEFCNAFCLSAQHCQFFYREIALADQTLKQVCMQFG